MQVRCMICSDCKRYVLSKDLQIHEINKGLDCTYLFQLLQCTTILYVYDISHLNHSSMIFGT